MDEFSAIKGGDFRFSMIRNALDDFYVYKRELTQAGVQHVSNAFIKMYEMLYELKIIEGLNTSGEKLYSFHNAEFPGSFIMGMKKYIADHHNGMSWKWYGSSFLDGPLKDEYGLYRSARDQWLMSADSPEMNGDVTSVDFQEYLVTKLAKKKILLYTSDLGFAISDYNNQESIQAHANFGQIVSGLLILAEGGTFITKGYTIFEPFTVSLTCLLSSFFEEFSIIKPASSRTLNSETYFYGKGYKPISKAMKKMLLHRLANFTLKPLVDKETLKVYSYDSIKHAISQMSTIQATKIDELMRYHKQFPLLNGKALFTAVTNKIKREKPDFIGALRAPITPQQGFGY
jgi:hypothetical protein